MPLKVAWFNRNLIFIIYGHKSAAENSAFTLMDKSIVKVIQITDWAKRNAVSFEDSFIINGTQQK